MKFKKTFYNISGNSVSLDYRHTTTLDSNIKKSRNYIGLKTAFIGLTIILIIQLIIIILLLSKKSFDYSTSNDENEMKDVIKQINTYWNNSNLPNFAKPKHYSITLQLLKEAFTQKEHEKRNYFFGNVVIDIEMKEDSKFIVLNIKELKIISIKMEYICQNVQRKSLKVFRIINDNVFEQVILIFNETLINSWHYSLNITYSGNITLSEPGIVRTFYRSFLLNKTYDILYTQLEPIGARSVFPCFDEPDKKALFTVKIIHFSKYTALSNMPLRERKNINKESLIIQDVSIKNLMSITLSSFNTTFIYMSTYLVAFVLMEDYEKIERERKPGYNVAIWGPKGFQSTGIISLQCSVYIENYLENYLNFSSPLTKTDHIYIPNFLFGAMENWGLITYHDNHLLISPRYGKNLAKAAYNTISHELAHIWFGNWVTTKTWKDLWLNEGFATYFATLAYNNFLNISVEESKEEKLFQCRQILQDDGKITSYPVKLKVLKINEIFNYFTYYKGEIILVWLNYIMGEEKFLLGMKSYIKKYAQKNPTTENFFAEMELKRPENLNFNESLYDFFSPWLTEVGYPVLTVNYDTRKNQLSVSQHSVYPNSTNDERWPVLTRINTDTNIINQLIYFQNCVKIDVNISSDDYILLNSDGSSYLRVNYNRFLFKKIITNIRKNTGSINSINKIVLFDDYFFFLDTGLIDISFIKDLMDTLVNETNRILWTIFYNRIFTKMYFAFGNDKIFFKWSTYVKKLSQKVLTKALPVNITRILTITEESFQKQIFLMNCAIDNHIIIDQLSELFKKWIIKPGGTVLPKHLVTLILYYGIRENDKEEYWMKMWNMMITNDESSPIDKDQIAIGLTGTSKSYRLNKLLDYILTPYTHNSNAGKHNFFNRFVRWIITSNNGFTIFIQWIMKNNEGIKKYAFGDNISNSNGDGYLQSLINNIALLTYDPYVLQPLLTSNSNKEYVNDLIKSNIKWKNNIKKTLLNYL